MIKSYKASDFGLWAMKMESDDFWTMMQSTTVDEDIVDPDPGDTGDPTEAQLKPVPEANSNWKQRPHCQCWLGAK